MAVDYSAAPTDSKGRTLLWSYGVNDHLEELPAEIAKSYKGAGEFRADFADLCAKCGIVAHPGLVPTPTKAKKDTRKGSIEIASNAVLALQSVLLDRASMLVFKAILPTALHIEVLRFTSCCLDVEMMALLRAGLTENCTVSALQLDWNPVDIPLDAQEVRPMVEAGSCKDLDNREQERERRQATRILRAFANRLTACFGDVSNAVKALRNSCLRDRTQYEATAGLEPFTLEEWVDAFHSVLKLGAVEAEKIFGILDGPFFGAEHGAMCFDSLEQALQNLPALSAEEEAADPIAPSFAAFVDSTSILEAVSFRHCELGLLEAQVLGKVLQTSHHLRGLNLWGNAICDQGAAAIAESFEHFYGLQYLGLGRNLVTHIGLEKLCKPLGYTRVDNKEQADAIAKDIKEKGKERDKRAKAPPPPKKDGKGRERYSPDFFMPSCEVQADSSTGEQYWLWGRNMTLRTLHLDFNPIADASAVLQVQQWGSGGELHLKGIPCIEELLRHQAEKAASVEKESEEAPPKEETTPEPIPKKPGSAAQAITAQGWKLVLQ